MRFLVIIGFVLISIQLSHNAEVYKILNDYYTCEFNDTLDMPPPQHVEYAYEGIFVYTANKRKLKISEMGNVTNVGSIRVVPRQMMTYSDVWNSLIQINKGEIDFMFRDTKKYEVKIKPNYRVFQLVPDLKKTTIYFLAKSPSVLEKVGSVFAMNTVKIDAHDGIIQCEELEFLGNRVAYMATSLKLGNIAVFTKSNDKYRFILLKPTSAPIEEKEPVKKEEVTTQKETTTSTETPKVQIRTLMSEECKANFRQTIAQGVERIRETYEKDMKYCRSMANKAQILFQKYSRTLELTNSEEDLVRKQNLPPLKLEQPYEVAIGNIIEDIGKELIQIFEETTASGTCGKNKFNLDSRATGNNAN